MNRKCGQINRRDRHNERGEGKVKLIIVLVILFLAGWAGFNYIPVAYQGQAFKQEMDTAILQAMGLPTASGDPVAWTKQRLTRTGQEYNIPEDAIIDVKLAKGGGAVEATVKFKRPVALLPFYTYEYEFDYTAKPGGFLTK
jgi:hypothetical protein